jgi:glycerol-3-phosphate acyltransferase PlsX
MKIAIDAMGGDYAPAEIVKGAVLGAREHGVGIILSGPEAVIKAELAKHDTKDLDISIDHTDEYLEEGENAGWAIRTKRRASIFRAVKQVLAGDAAAAVGVGPTGGVITAALMVLGTIEGLSRPVIGGAFLGFTPETLTIDLGGSVDCRPDQLLDFGIIGSVYAKTWMGIENPAVALLSNGKEEGKGNEAVKEAYPLFERSGLNFVGLAEGYDVALGKANVIITDGFTGNVMAKFCEGLGEVTADWLTKRLKDNLPEAEVAQIIKDLKMATIPADTVGGGPLWGVNGVVCKAHGRSKAPEVASTIGTAKRAVEIDLVGTFQRELAEIKKNITLPEQTT